MHWKTGAVFWLGVFALCFFPVGLCVAVEKDGTGGDKQPVSLPADAVFVNDGKIIVIDSKGALIDSGIYGEDPCLSSDGAAVFYTKRTLLDKIEPFHPSFPRYGIAAKDDGICSWDIKTGAVKKVCRNGCSPKISPNGELMAYNHNSGLYVVNVKTGVDYHLVAASKYYAWLGDDNLAYSDDGQIKKISVSGGRKRQIASGNGEPIKSEDANGALRELLQKIAQGKPYEGYYQSELCSCANGQKIVFCQQELGFSQGIFKACVAVFAADDKEKVQGKAVIRSSGNPKFDTINSMAVSSSGNRVAFSQIVTERFLQPLWEVNECDLFVADLDKPAVASSGLDCAVSKIGRLPVADELAFSDEDTVFLMTIDKSKTMISIGGGASCVIGLRGLSPDQLKMMGLSKEISEADMIYKINVSTGKKTFFSSGHGVMARKK